MGKVLSLVELSAVRKRLKREGKTVVFTNGVFDIIHRGHVEYLDKAKGMGDVLIIGLNSDSSVRRIKGPERPINPQADRAVVLSSLAVVDYVCVFEEDTPIQLIAELVPDILVKGADWQTNAIVGKDIVERAGGKVLTVELVPGRSTTNIVRRIKDANSHTAS